MSRSKKKSLAYKNINFIKLLTDYRKHPKQFKKLIKHCTDNEVNAVTEIIYNFLHGHLKCDTKKYKKLKEFLRLVGDKKNLQKPEEEPFFQRGEVC